MAGPVELFAAAEVADWVSSLDDSAVALPAAGLAIAFLADGSAASMADDSSEAEASASPVQAGAFAAAKAAGSDLSRADLPVALPEADSG